MDHKLNLKKELKAECLRLLEERILTASEAMAAAQESANSEGKSSAGDKYETSRAMGQQDRDMNARQLEQARKDLAFVQSLDAGKKMQTAGLGALIYCREGIFFLVAGLGSVRIGNEQIHIISPAAPMASMLLNKNAGEKISFNGKTFEIIEVI